MYKIYTVLWLLVFAMACTTDEPIKTTDSRGSIGDYAVFRYRFSTVVGNIPLAFNAQRYVTTLNDTFSVEQFKWYFGPKYPVCYPMDSDSTRHFYLVEADRNRVEYSVRVKPGTYEFITFSVGIDSVWNYDITRIGQLSPSAGMVWDWNTGYKFLLMEGRYFKSDTVKPIVFHIGEDVNYKLVSLPLPRPIKADKNQTYTINVEANINAMFDLPHPIRLGQWENSMFGEDARKVANNYAYNMFRIR